MHRICKEDRERTDSVDSHTIPEICTPLKDVGMDIEDWNTRTLSCTELLFDAGDGTHNAVSRTDPQICMEYTLFHECTDIRNRMDNWESFCRVEWDGNRDILSCYIRASSDSVQLVPFWYSARLFERDYASKGTYSLVLLRFVLTYSQ
jgi:hypothetical protein